MYNDDIDIIDKVGCIFVRFIGNGQFGRCYLCKRANDEFELVIKIVNIDPKKADAMQSAINEVNIMDMVKDHPNIVSIYFYKIIDNQYLVTAMEFCPDGDMQRLIDLSFSQKRSFSEAQLISWSVQLLRAVDALQERNIIHRDIKPNNIFILDGGSRLKLGDFGAAKVIDKELPLNEVAVGTPFYLAPEIFQKKPAGFPIDIWSIGICIFQLVTGVVPFSSKNLLRLSHVVCSNPLPVVSGISPAFNSILKILLTKDPSVRPMAFRVLQESIFRFKIPVIKRALKLNNTVVDDVAVLFSNVGFTADAGAQAISYNIVSNKNDDYDESNAVADKKLNTNTTKQNSAESLSLILAGPILLSRFCSFENDVATATSSSSTRMPWRVGFAFHENILQQQIDNGRTAIPQNARLAPRQLALSPPANNTNISQNANPDLHAKPQFGLGLGFNEIRGVVHAASINILSPDEVDAAAKFICLRTAEKHRVETLLQEMKLNGTIESKHSSPASEIVRLLVSIPEKEQKALISQASVSITDLEILISEALYGLHSKDAPSMTENKLKKAKGKTTTSKNNQSLSPSKEDDRNTQLEDLNLVVKKYASEVRNLLESNIKFSLLKSNTVSTVFSRSTPFTSLDSAYSPLLPCLLSGANAIASAFQNACVDVNASQATNHKKVITSHNHAAGVNPNDSVSPKFVNYSGDVGFISSRLFFLLTADVNTLAPRGGPPLNFGSLMKIFNTMQTPAKVVKQYNSLTAQVSSRCVTPTPLDTNDVKPEEQPLQNSKQVVTNSSTLTSIGDVRDDLVQSLMKSCIECIIDSNALKNTTANQRQSTTPAENLHESMSSSLLSPAAAAEFAYSICQLLSNKDEYGQISLTSFAQLMSSLFKVEKKRDENYFSAENDVLKCLIDIDSDPTDLIADDPSIIAMSSPIKDQFKSNLKERKMIEIRNKISINASHTFNARVLSRFHLRLGCKLYWASFRYPGGSLNDSEVSIVCDRIVFGIEKLYKHKKLDAIFNWASNHCKDMLASEISFKSSSSIDGMSNSTDDFNSDPDSSSQTKSDNGIVHNHATIGSTSQSGQSLNAQNWVTLSSFVEAVTSCPLIDVSAWEAAECFIAMCVSYRSQEIHLIRNKLHEIQQHHSSNQQSKGSKNKNKDKDKTPEINLSAENILKILSKSPILSPLVAAHEFERRTGSVKSFKQNDSSEDSLIHTDIKFSNIFEFLQLPLEAKPDKLTAVQSTLNSKHEPNALSQDNDFHFVAIPAPLVARFLEEKMSNAASSIVSKPFFDPPESLLRFIGLSDDIQDGKSDLTKNILENLLSKWYSEELQILQDAYKKSNHSIVQIHIHDWNNNNSLPLSSDKQFNPPSASASVVVDSSTHMAINSPYSIAPSGFLPPNNFLHAIRASSVLHSVASEVKSTEDQEPLASTIFEIDNEWRQILAWAPKNSNGMVNYVRTLQKLAAWAVSPPIERIRSIHESPTVIANDRFVYLQLKERKSLLVSILTSLLSKSNLESMFSTLFLRSSRMSSWGSYNQSLSTNNKDDGLRIQEENRGSHIPIFGNEVLSFSKDIREICAYTTAGKFFHSAISSEISLERALCSLDILGDGLVSADALFSFLCCNKSIVGCDNIPQFVASDIVTCALQFQRNILGKSVIDILCKQFVFDCIGSAVAVSSDNEPSAKKVSLISEFEKVKLKWNNFSQSILKPIKTPIDTLQFDEANPEEDTSNYPIQDVFNDALSQISFKRVSLLNEISEGGQVILIPLLIIFFCLCGGSTGLEDPDLIAPDLRTSSRIEFSWPSSIVDRCMSNFGVSERFLKSNIVFQEIGQSLLLTSLEFIILRLNNVGRSIEQTLANETSVLKFGVSPEAKDVSITSLSASDNAQINFDNQIHQFINNVVKKSGNNLKTEGLIWLEMYMLFSLKNIILHGVRISSSIGPLRAILHLPLPGVLNRSNALAAINQIGDSKNGSKPNGTPNSSSHAPKNKKNDAITSPMKDLQTQSPFSSISSQELTKLYHYALANSRNIKSLLPACYFPSETAFESQFYSKLVIEAALSALSKISSVGDAIAVILQLLDPFASFGSRLASVMNLQIALEFVLSFVDDQTLSQMFISAAPVSIASAVHAENASKLLQGQLVDSPNSPPFTNLNNSSLINMTSNRLLKDLNINTIGHTRGFGGINAAASTNKKALTIKKVISIIIFGITGVLHIPPPNTSVQSLLSNISLEDPGYDEKNNIGLHLCTWTLIPGIDVFKDVATQPCILFKLHWMKLLEIKLFSVEPIPAIIGRTSFEAINNQNNQLNNKNKLPQEVSKFLDSSTTSIPVIPSKLMGGSLLVVVAPFFRNNDPPLTNTSNSKIRFHDETINTPPPIDDTSSLSITKSIKLPKKVGILELDNSCWLSELRNALYSNKNHANKKVSESNEGHSQRIWGNIYYNASAVLPMPSCFTLLSVLSRDFVEDNVMKREIVYPNLRDHLEHVHTNAVFELLELRKKIEVNDDHNKGLNDISRNLTPIDRDVDTHLLEGLTSLELQLSRLQHFKSKLPQTDSSVNDSEHEISINKIQEHFMDVPSLSNNGCTNDWRLISSSHSVLRSPFFPNVPVEIENLRRVFSSTIGTEDKKYSHGIQPQVVDYPLEGIEESKHKEGNTDIKRNPADLLSGKHLLDVPLPISWSSTSLSLPLQENNRRIEHALRTFMPPIIDQQNLGKSVHPLVSAHKEQLAQFANFQALRFSGSSVNYSASKRCLTTSKTGISSSSLEWVSPTRSKILRAPGDAYRRSGSISSPEFAAGTINSRAGGFGLKSMIVAASCPKLPHVNGSRHDEKKMTTTSFELIPGNPINNVLKAVNVDSPHSPSPSSFTSLPEMISKLKQK